MTDTLARIEEKHKGTHTHTGEVWLASEVCDVVKLARALDELRRACDDGGPALAASRALGEVAGA